jgi:hypothetical protein
MQSLSKFEQLEVDVFKHPNNIQINQAILVVIGGMGLARGLWQQSPLQLAPRTDSTQQADS